MERITAAFRGLGRHFERSKPSESPFLVPETDHQAPQAEKVAQAAYEFILGKATPDPSSEIVVETKHEEVNPVNVEEAPSLSGVAFDPEDRNIMTIIYNENETLE